MIVIPIIVSEDLKERIRKNRIEGEEEINLEQKMDIKERQKAKKKAQEEYEKTLYEETGLYDKSKNLTMDNLIKKYEYDMERIERRMAKMELFEKKGMNYSYDDIKLTDDEDEENGGKDFFERLYEKDFAKRQKQYEDEPYKAKEEEESNYETQLKNIE